MNPDVRDRILQAFREAKDAGEDDNRFHFPWSTTIWGSDGRALYLFERSDRPGSLRVRWQANQSEADARDGETRPKLGLRPPVAIRDERGRLRRKALDRATEAAKAEYEEWLHPAPAGEASSLAPTLEDVLRHFLDADTGKPITPRWRREVGSFPIDRNRASHLNIIREALGLNTPPADIRISHLRRTWRLVAKQHGKSGIGARKAEQVVSTLISALEWGRPDGLVGNDSTDIPEKWRAQLRKEWTALTNRTAFEPTRPPYSAEETKRILAALPQADPRIRLPIELGAGYRIGQLAENLTRKGIKEAGVFGLRAE